MIFIKSKTFLPSYERKSSPKFQKKLLQMINNPTFQL